MQQLMREFCLGHIDLSNFQTPMLDTTVPLNIKPTILDLFNDKTKKRVPGHVLIGEKPKYNLHQTRGMFRIHAQSSLMLGKGRLYNFNGKAYPVYLSENSSFLFPLKTSLISKLVVHGVYWRSYYEWVPAYNIIYI